MRKRCQELRLLQSSTLTILSLGCEDLLGPVRDMLVYDRILLSYAEVLMHWDALQPRAEVASRELRHVRAGARADNSNDLLRTSR